MLRLTALALVAALAVATPVGGCSQQVQEAPFVQSADGITGYLGVAPRAIIDTHAPQHEEQRMHAALPNGDAHLVLALFDTVSGQRIENAGVEAVVRSDRHGGAMRMRLEPMRIENALTYGAFMSLDTTTTYHIDVIVRRGSGDHATHLRFVFDARGLPARENRS